ncbi:N-methyl-L-tryptophan oxidase [Occallatibacter riparius]|uniref:N-methyl-L-tryptophan oxidase n=1 Tax=Occallatibacter riparius TaxID=1002689 RepID=A0A9J7BNP2_9BACT|nr:N-methyl-L-tryptophan oxidase [Occallatibacter riparius]UWZ83370.1 N-methyl-L-tryptophan oxidase [Occallatibacter riparius]
MSYDVIVLGLGAMGSAAAYHLAARGVRVLGIEQFMPAHDHGSSHGGSRIIRQAYFESADYIPLVLRAYELWRKLERDAGARLLHVTGGMTLGSRHGELVRRTMAAAREHAIPFEVLEGAEIAERFPAVRPLTGDVAVVEPHAGYLLPEECIRAHLKMAERAGAELHFEERAIAWSGAGHGVEVRTSRGTYSAGHLVIAAGPWAESELAGVFPLRVTRQVMAWIQPRGGVTDFVPERFPVWLAEDPEGGAVTYGFPAIDGEGGGVKAAIHGSDVVCTPETIDREIHAADLKRIVERVKVRMPALDGEVLRAKTCMYTKTPDENFVIGSHPHVPNCTVACGFSGHGFKFSSVVGEVLADLAVRGKTDLPVGIFDPERFEGRD